MNSLPRKAALTIAVWVLACPLVPSCARTAAEPNAGGPGAYDVIKLGRLSDEIGPVYFAHGLHASLKDAAGRTISCERCHRIDPGCWSDPPKGCANCHLPHGHSARGGPPST